MARYQATYKESGSSSPLLDLKAHWRRVRELLASERQKSRSLLAKRAWKIRRTLLKRRARIKAEWGTLLEREGTPYVQQAYKSAILRAEEDCLQLSLSLVKRFIGKARETCSGALIDQIKKEINELKKETELLLLIHPKDKTIAIKELQDIYPHLSVQSDNKIKKGKAKLETHSGTLLIDWEDSFSKLSRELYRKLHEGMA